MIKVLVSVKDEIAEVFNDPRAEINAASAIRAFSHSVKESPNKDDFTLYIVGEIDTRNGVINGNKDNEGKYPIRIYSGHDVLKSEKAVA